MPKYRKLPKINAKTTSLQVIHYIPPLPLLFVTTLGILLKVKLAFKNHQEHSSLADYCLRTRKSTS